MLLDYEAEPPPLELKGKPAALESDVTEPTPKVTELSSDASEGSGHGQFEPPITIDQIGFAISLRMSHALVSGERGVYNPQFATFQFSVSP